MKILKINLFLFVTVSCFCQVVTKRALFIGNSYTYVNDLPFMVAQMANSDGDQLIYDSNTIGGYTLEDHATNAVTLAKINQGNWDYVVLQEQSQIPAFPLSFVQNNVFPYAQQLSNLITTANPCAETTFYMTWGRQNGDTQNCPYYTAVCTYEGMDDLLKQRYMTMTSDNDAIVAPVGVVWRYIRENYPGLNLYSSDGSHPSVEGTYLAACTFYATFFRKDPTQITYNSTVSTTNATLIKQAVKQLVYENRAAWSIGSHDPTANFTYSLVSGTTFQFNNQSLNAASFAWDFGDGFTSTQTNPLHTFVTAGNYTVTLQSTKCNRLATSTQVINTTLSNYTAHLYGSDLVLFPNPVKNSFKLLHQTENDLEYTIFSMTGQKVKNGRITKGGTINVSLLENGVYCIGLKSETQVEVFKKFIKAN